MWKKCLMPWAPREEMPSRCTKRFCPSIPIANIGLPAFFISSAVGVPSVVLFPSDTTTVSAINSYNTISKSPLAHHNHRRCTDIHKKCDVIPCYVNGKYHQMSLCVFSKSARDERTYNCKMISTSKCASIRSWYFMEVIVQLIKIWIRFSSKTPKKIF